MTKTFSRIPASFFGMLLGLNGLGFAWREAAVQWSAPTWAGEAILAGAALIWITLLILYAGKALTAPGLIAAEWAHPVQSSFMALIPITTMLTAIAAAPHAVILSQGMFLVGGCLQLVFVVWHTGAVWRSDRSFEGTTPALYIPTVAGGLVSCIAASATGFPDLAKLCFGAGMLGWLALESIILRRPVEQAAMPIPMRPILGIQFGPPTVACVAYLAITSGPPDLFAQALFGYGVLQALILIRLLPWIMEQPFAPSYWAFSFGTAAIAVAAIRCLARGVEGPIAWMALPLLAIATVIIAGLSIATVRFVLAGKL